MMELNKIKDTIKILKKENARINYCNSIFCSDSNKINVRSHESLGDNENSYDIKFDNENGEYLNGLKKMYLENNEDKFIDLLIFSKLDKRNKQFNFDSSL